MTLARRASEGASGKSPRRVRRRYGGVPADPPRWRSRAGVPRPAGRMTLARSQAREIASLTLPRQHPHQPGLPPSHPSPDLRKRGERSPHRRGAGPSVGPFPLACASGWGCAAGKRIGEGRNCGQPPAASTCPSLPPAPPGRGGRGGRGGRACIAEDLLAQAVVVAAAVQGPGQHQLAQRFAARLLGVRAAGHALLAWPPSTVGVHVAPTCRAWPATRPAAWPPRDRRSAPGPGRPRGGARSLARRSAGRASRGSPAPPGRSRVRPRATISLSSGLKRRAELAHAAVVPALVPLGPAADFGRSASPRPCRRPAPPGPWRRSACPCPSAAGVGLAPAAAAPARAGPGSRPRRGLVLQARRPPAAIRSSGSGYESLSSSTLSGRLPISTRCCCSCLEVDLPQPARRPWPPWPRPRPAA